MRVDQRTLFEEVVSKISSDKNGFYHYSALETVWAAALRSGHKSRKAVHMAMNDVHSKYPRSTPMCLTVGKNQMLTVTKDLVTCEKCYEKLERGDVPKVKVASTAIHGNTVINVPKK